MNLKKIIAAVAAAALALSLMAIPTSAAVDELTFKMELQNAGYGDVYSFTKKNVDLTIQGNGDYTFVMDVTDITSDEWTDIRAYASKAAPAAYKDATITVKSFKINDVALPVVDQTVPLLGAGSKVDFNIFNCWYLPANFVVKGGVVTTFNDGGNNAYKFLDADGVPIVATSFTMECTVAGVVDAEAEAAAAAEAEAAAAAEAEAAAEGETTEAAATEAAATEAAATEAAATEAAATEAAPAEEAPAEEAALEDEAVTEAPVVEEAPAVVETTVVVEAPATTAPATGNVPVMVVAGVMALAGIGALVSKKK